MRWHLKRKQQCLYIQLRVACDLRRLQSGCYCLAVLFVSMHVRCVCSFYAVGVKTQTSCTGFLAWAPAIPATVPLDVIILQAFTFECCVRTSWDINCGRQELRCPSSERVEGFLSCAHACTALWHMPPAKLVLQPHARPAWEHNLIIWHCKCYSVLKIVQRLMHRSSVITASCLGPSSKKHYTYSTVPATQWHGRCMHSIAEQSKTIHS